MSRKNQIHKNINKGSKKKQPEGSLTKPFTPKQAHHTAGAEARQEYAPTIRAAKADIRASKTRQKQEGQWYGQLADQTTQAATETDASYDAANAAMRANIEAAARAAQTSTASVAGADAQFSALTGADPKAFAPGIQEANNAAAQRSLAGAALAAPIAAAGANQASYLRNTAVNAKHEGIYQRQQEGKRRAKSKEDLTGLRTERAQKTAANYRGIRKEERDYKIQNRAFPLEKAKLKAEAGQDAIDNQQAQEALNETHRHNKATEGKNGLTPSEEHTRHKEKVTDQRTQKAANGTARTLYASIPADKKPTTPQQWQQFILLVKAELGEGADYINAKKAVAKLRKSVGGGNGNLGADPNGASLGR